MYGTDGGSGNLGTIQETLVVSGTTFQIAYDSPSDGCKHATLTVATSSNQFTDTETCGNLFGTGGDGGVTTVLTGSYTATSTSVTVAFAEGNGTTNVFTLTKQ